MIHKGLSALYNWIVFYFIGKPLIAYGPVCLHEFEKLLMSLETRKTTYIVRCHTNASRQCLEPVTAVRAVSNANLLLKKVHEYMSFVEGSLLWIV